MNNDKGLLLPYNDAAIDYTVYTVVMGVFIRVNDVPLNNLVFLDVET